MISEKNGIFLGGGIPIQAPNKYLFPCPPYTRTILKNRRQHKDIMITEKGE